MQRILVEVDAECLELLDRLAEAHLPRQELSQYQWLHQTKEGQRLWQELSSNQQVLSSMSSKQINDYIGKRYREHCPPVMGRPAVARARSAALKELLQGTKLREAA